MIRKSVYRVEESSALDSTKIGKACGPDNRICLCSKVVKGCKEQLVTPTKAMRLFQVSLDKWVCHPFTVNVISLVKLFCVCLSCIICLRIFRTKMTH